MPTTNHQTPTTNPFVDLFNKVTLYACCSQLALLIFKTFCRIHVVTLEEPPKQGPLIMASNHISHFEPSLLSGLFPRDLDWVAMEELFRTPWSARFFSKLNLIAVDRFEKDAHGNRRALQIMIKRLSQGRAIAIFPEGGIRTGEASILNGAPMKPGLATLSFLTQAPIIPCVVLGTECLYKKKSWLQRPHLWILIGKKILPPSPTKIKFAREEALHNFQNELSLIFPALQEEILKRIHHKEHKNYTKNTKRVFL